MAPCQARVNSPKPVHGGVLFRQSVGESPITAKARMGHIGSNKLKEMGWIDEY